MRISDWSSDVCSSDLAGQFHAGRPAADDGEGEQRAFRGRIGFRLGPLERGQDPATDVQRVVERLQPWRVRGPLVVAEVGVGGAAGQQQVVVAQRVAALRSEEHTSELQSLMRISYAVFCLKQKNNTN